MSDKPGLKAAIQNAFGRGDTPHHHPTAHMIVRHLRGDNEAFPEIVSMYRSSVYTYLIRSGVVPDARDDLFQDIFLSIHRYANRYDPTLPLAPWLFTIVANSVRDFFRKRSRDRLELDDRIALEKASSHSSEEAIEAKKTASWLESEIQKLPFPEREVFLLCSVKDLEQAEVAKILSIPVNTVKTHVRRAKLKLAAALQSRERK